MKAKKRIIWQAKFRGNNLCVPAGFITTINGNRYKAMSKSLNRALTKNYEYLRFIQKVYRKHVQGDDSIGWEELEDAAYLILSDFMGDDEFVKWAESKIPLRKRRLK